MKFKVLFILPHCYFAHLPHFTSRFEHLQDTVESHVLFTGDPSLNNTRFPWGTLHVLPPLQHHNVTHKLLHTLRMIRHGARIVRQEGLDTVIAYDPLKLGLIASAIKLMTGCKLIVEVNGHYRDAKALTLSGQTPSSATKMAFNTCCRTVLSFADLVKLLSPEQLCEWHSILSRKKYVFFHDFVPVSFFPQQESKGHTILTAGFPFQLKGVDLLLDAFARLKPAHPNARLVVMGHGREPELSQWRTRVEAVPGAELRKPVPYDQMPGTVQACDIFAMPSRTEGVPRIFIEAMACGKPLVGTRVGGIPNVIQDGINGFLVEPENVDALAEKLHVLLADSFLRERMGAAGAQLARSTFSEEQYSRHVTAMLEAVHRDGLKETGMLFNGFESANLNVTSRA